jgi:glucose-6-phosphate dehydrogenase assembly protein OpcA
MAPAAGRQSDIDIADLAWRRLKPLRHALVQAVDPTVLNRPVGHVRMLTIETSAEHHASAWLLAAWIASRLGWRPVQRAVRDSSASLTFEGHHGRVTTAIAVSGQNVVRVAIETDAFDGGAVLDAVQTSDEIVVRYGWDVPPLTVIARRWSTAEMVAAELRNLYVDAYLRDALALLTRVETLRS